MTSKKTWFITDAVHEALEELSLEQIDAFRELSSSPALDEAGRPS